MKKVTALLLAIVMVLGLGTMASASAPADRVQINNMMVDASLVETQNEEVAELEMVVPESSIATTAFDPSTNPSFAPIKNITVDWANSTVEAVGAMQGRVRYNLTMPGAANSLTGRKLTFAFSNRTSVIGDIIVTMGTKTCSAGVNESATMQVDLTAGEQLFTVSWNDAGTQKTVTCALYVTTPDVASVELTSLTVAGTPAEYDTTTVGGVTRYNYVAALPSGTAETVLTNATVVVNPVSDEADLTLTNANGTDAATSTSADGHTFYGVDFSSGTKTLLVEDGELSREYSVAAHIEDSTVTVKIAIRTYLVNEWLNGSTNYYDYETNGFGSGSDLSQTERSNLTAAAAALAAHNMPNAPTQVGSGRRIFSGTSYVTLSDIDANATVMDVLEQFLAQNSLSQEGAGNNYVERMGPTGNMIGEFDCGSGSGWVYTVRTAPDDIESSLPNVGAKNYSVFDGMYIDWYYTAAYGMDFGYSMFDI